MCNSCKPWDAMTEDERDEAAEQISARFVSLPLVTGAPLIMDVSYYREVARHLLECGLRLCQPSIKSYVAPTDLEGRTGGWVYDESHQDTETPTERVQRMAREQREDYIAEVERRRAAGEMPAAPRTEFGTRPAPEGGNRAQRRAQKGGRRG